MDNVDISSAFTTKIISSIAQKAVKKKYGSDIQINVKHIVATAGDGKVKLGLNIVAEIPEKDLTRFIHGLL